MLILGSLSLSLSLDVNECNTGAHNCTQKCTNTDGGFKCSCNKGYRLANDDVTCSGNQATISIATVYILFHRY